MPSHSILRAAPILGSLLLSMLAGAAGAPPAADRPARPHGRVTEHTLGRRADGQPRAIWIYTPAGVPPGDSSSCDLLLAFDGGEYQQEIRLPAMLDSLIAAGRIRPTVAVLVDNASSGTRLADLANHEAFVTFVAKDLVPWVRQHCGVSRDPHRTTVTGSSAGGLCAAFVALRHPELFGNVLSQSGAFWRGAEGSSGAPLEWLTTQYAGAPRRDVRFVLEVGSTESHGAIGGTAPSILDANRHLRDVLRAKGYAVTYTEVAGGVHAPVTWAPRLPGALVSLVGLAVR